MTRFRKATWSSATPCAVSIPSTVRECRLWRWRPQALDEELARGIHRLAPRFYSRAWTIIDIPWAIATGEDMRIPQVEGTRRAGFRIMSRYLERLHAVAAEDRIVCRQFMTVLNLLTSPASLLSPPIAWRVLTRRIHSGGLASPHPTAASSA